MLHASEVELTETTKKLIAAIDRYKPTRLVLDSLSEMRLLAQSSLRYRRQVLALKQLFLGRNCTVIMLDDRTAEGPDLQLHSIAHAVISLEAQSPRYGRMRRQLEVRKFRGSDFSSGLHDFAIESDGLAIFPRLVASDPLVAYKQTLVQSHVKALDELMGADSLSMLLALEGHTVRTVYNAHDAIELAPTYQPDLILLDIGLPAMDGYEVARRLRAAGVLARLVALTGYGQQDDIKRALAAGFDAHIAKPVDLGRIEQLIRPATPSPTAQR